ncbi:hypothetical protein K443DRAFT_12099 [Laccaria amethystina LaAM-08-1]|uniref:T6SS Phospholipase effector Tle1-like catalytic domain-containing protein n=1 Tax=Laccaria amethystina LaAM-08-1 TaxID=1095629 RepID=A0A0C9X9X5_9AGAR|nr:hypothetical protein K443DRAFT_12099 [Laccaria amethystina LaAM-08-1]
MSSSSSSDFVPAMDNTNYQNSEHTTKNPDDKSLNAGLTDHLPPGADSNSKTASDKPRMPCDHKLNGRNLIVCIDGTSNQFGEKNTNVIELYNLILKKDEGNQRTWYNSGIGTYARPSWKSLNFYKKVLYHKIDLAIAWDFERTVLGAYRWLSDNYKTDDCIFLFGFSRGAFQVRVLSAMIEKVGLVFKGNEMQIPFAYELYVEGTQKMANHFKKTFSNEDVMVHFIGAWDTVSSIGIARGKAMLPGTVVGMKHVCYFRHALALDERRVKFLPEYAYGGCATDPTTKPATEPLKPIDNTRESKGTLPQTKEVWFAGTHSDIGGGNVYNEEMDRSTPPLRWMIFEAGAAGLRTALFERELKDTEQINFIESLTWHWLFFEICPFKRLTFTRNENGKPETTRWPHRGKGRKIHPGQKIHSSLVRAGGSTADHYTPKARSYLDDKRSFWKLLRAEDKALTDEWLEVDLSEHIKHAVEELVTKGDDTALKSLYHTSISRDARQVVYESVIKALHQEELTVENKHLLLQTTMQLLERTSRDDLDFKLRPLKEIRPLLSDLFCDNPDYWRTARDFVTVFTTCVKIVQLKGDDFYSLAISPDGTRIASGIRSNGMVQIWDAETGTLREPLRGHTDSTWSVAFSPNGTRIVSGSGDTTVRIWDAETSSPVGEPLRGHDDWVSSVAFSPNGRRIVSGWGNGTVRIWDVETGSPVGVPLRGHEYQTVRIWDAETGSPVGESLRGHVGSVWSVAFSPEGTRIVSGSADRTVRIWDAETGSPVGQPSEGHNQVVNSVAFSPDGTHIISASDDRTVRIWDAETGSPVGEPLEGHTGTVECVAISPDGTRITSISFGGTVRIWDVDALGILNATKRG